MHLSFLVLTQLQLRESETNKVLDGMCQLDNENDLEVWAVILLEKTICIE